MEFEYGIEEISATRHRRRMFFPLFIVKVIEQPIHLYCCELLHLYMEDFITAYPFKKSNHHEYEIGLRFVSFDADLDDYDYSEIIHYCPFCGEKLSYTSTRKTSL